MNDIDKKIDEIITYIKTKEEYKRCIELKEKMKGNKELTTLIDDIKKKQKEYINSNYDEKAKKDLDILNERLDTFPIYLEYNANLRVVNEMISLLKSSLDNYFDSVINFDL